MVIYLENKEENNYVFMPILKQIYNLFYSKSLRKYSFKNNLLNRPFDNIYGEAIKDINMVVIKTLVYDINTMRIEKKFKSNNINLQYEEFNNYYSYNFDSLKLLLDKYPLLYSVLRVLSRDFLNFINEFYLRLEKDLDKILKNKFNLNGNIIKLNFFGDHHNNHKRNIKISFEYGSIFYKPHSLDTNSFIKDVLCFINSSKNPYVTFNIPEFINKGYYGWQEFIEPYKNGFNDLHKIYSQFGSLSAFSYIFNLADLHNENIILSDNKVFLIDSENLFQNDLNRSHKNDSITEKIDYNLYDSILKSGLYPTSNYSIDISGITGRGGQLAPKSIYKVFNKKSSNIYLKKVNYNMPLTYNIPYVNDEIVNPLDYSSDILKSIKKTLNFFSLHSNELKKLLIKFKGMKTRVILRNTKDYGQIVGLLTNPRFLYKDNLDSLINKLIKSSSEDSILSSSIRYEIKDLIKLDIPYFYSKFMYDYIYDCYGNEVFQTKENSFSEIMEKINNLSIYTINKQLHIANIALSKPIKNWDLGNTKNFIEHSNVNRSIKDKNLFLLIDSLGKQLLKKGIYSKRINKISWIDISINQKSKWSFSPMGYSLYNGLPGVIVTLVYLYYLTNCSIYKYRYISALNELEFIINNLVEQIEDISVFNGSGGLVYMYFILYKLTNKLEYYKNYNFWLNYSFNLVDITTKKDFIGGLSGFLVLITNLYKQNKNKKILNYIKYIEKILVNNRQLKVNNLKTWESDIIPKHYLNGMSHGISGILYALSKSYSVTGSASTKEVIIDNISLEDISLINNNWIDLRNRENRIKKGFPDPVHWCHGAAGIGMSRIFTFNSVDSSDVVFRDIKCSIDGTLEKGFGGCDSLCHGNFGNLDLLIQMGSFKNEYLIKAKEICSELVKNKSSYKDFVYGIPNKNVNVYGLMTGLSGIIYQLMRIYDPVTIPSIIMMNFRG